MSESTAKEGRKALQKRLLKFIESNNTSANKIAGKIFRKNGKSIAPGTLSQWLNDKYPNESGASKIDEAVETFLEHQAERKLFQKDEIPFMRLSNTERVFEIAQWCHYKKGLGVLTGLAGLGKSMALEHYAKQHPDVIFIRANLSYTAKVLLREIARKLGLEPLGGINDLLNKIIERLRDTEREIIIDEAENLPVRALDLTRTIHDEANIGILLAGHPILRENLMGWQNDFAYLWSRVGKVIQLDRFTESDTEKIVGYFFPNSNGLHKTFHIESLRNGRILKNLIFRTIEVTELNNNIEPTPELVKEVGQKLILKVVR